MDTSDLYDALSSFDGFCLNEIMSQPNTQEDSVRNDEDTITEHHNILKDETMVRDTDSSVSVISSSTSTTSKTSSTSEDTSPNLQKNTINYWEKFNRPSLFQQKDFSRFR